VTCAHASADSQTPTRPIGPGGVCWYAPASQNICVPEAAGVAAIAAARRGAPDRPPVPFVFQNACSSSGPGYHPVGHSSCKARYLHWNGSPRSRFTTPHTGCASRRRGCCIVILQMPLRSIGVSATACPGLGDDHSTSDVFRPPISVPDDVSTPKEHARAGRRLVPVDCALDQAATGASLVGLLLSPATEIPIQIDLKVTGLMATVI
jgi:hypothetical protein